MMQHCLGFWWLSLPDCVPTNGQGSKMKRLGTLMRLLITTALLYFGGHLLVACTAGRI